MTSKEQTIEAALPLKQAPELKDFMVQRLSELVQLRVIKKWMLKANLGYRLHNAIVDAIAD